MSNLYDYICPFCLRGRQTDDPFARCCGHYMEETQHWDFALWQESRDYEISLLGDEYQQYFEECKAAYLQKQSIGLEASA